MQHEDKKEAKYQRRDKSNELYHRNTQHAPRQQKIAHTRFHGSDVRAEQLVGKLLDENTETEGRKNGREKVLIDQAKNKNPVQHPSHNRY